MKIPSEPNRHASVESGSRLHFGLIRVGNARRRFGGLGLMMDSPKVALRARQAREWCCEGPFSPRVLEIAKSLVRRVELEYLGPLAFAVDAAPTPHSGLGSGTQITLSTAAAIYALGERMLPAPRQLAVETGRGRRSAIGCHGFYQGGLLFEGGKQEDEPLSELQCRVDFPPDWRLLLIRPTMLEGVAGPSEGKFFEIAPDDNGERAETMTKLAREVLIPAAFEADFNPFAKALFDYGCLAGASFAFAQGDIFSHPQTRARVEDLRRRGVVGVGQSSWGPTVFALMKNAADAERLQQELRELPLYQDCEIWITAARNSGAEIAVSP
jgi:beta-ribofuranosylaminobenzene 5'-phosphate synthase